MKRDHGFSIMETMVGIGIVSVVGLGMYTGFSQLNDAVNQNKSLSQATTSQNLLLSLLEADLANHGLGITDAQPACLVDYDASTNTFQSTCDGGLVSVPSPGIVTCRDDPDSDDALLTLTYRVTATELAAANTGPTLTPAQIEAQFAGTSNPLDWVIRHTWTQPNCTDYPSAAGLAEYLDNNLPFVGQGIQGVLGKVLEVNAAELSFSNTNGNLNVNFTPNIERVLTTSGNNTSVADIGLQTTADLEAVSLIDQVADLPVVSFPYGTYLLRPSGASTPPDIPIEIPVPIFRETVDSSELDVGFVLEEKDADGNWQAISMPGDSYTIRAGEQPSAQAVAINVDRRIRLFSGAGYVLGEHPVANALSTEATDEQNHKLTVRMLWPELAVQRAPGAETRGTIIMNRPLELTAPDLTINLRLSGGVCGGDAFNVSSDSDYMLNVHPGTDPSSPPGTPPANFTDCNDATTDSETGDLILPIVMNNASGPMNAVEVQVMVNASGAEETLTMSLEPNVGVQYEGPTSHSLDFVEAGILPTVNFVQTEAVAIEPVPGEQRGTQLTVFFDPPPMSAMTLVLEDNTNSAELTCHPTTGNYFFLDSTNNPLSLTNLTTWTDAVSSNEFTLNAASTGIAIGDCVDVGDGGAPLRPISVQAGTQELSIPIRLRPSTAEEHDYRIDVGIAPQPSSYTVGDRNTALVRIEEYARVGFNAASAVIDEDDGASGWRQETIPLSIRPVLNEPLTAYVGIYLGDPTDSNVLAASAPGDIQFAANSQSISIPAGASTAQVIYQIENDVEFDRGKAFYAKINRVVGGALPGPTPSPIFGMPENSILATIIDQDRCAVGAGLTGGSLPTDHFHSRGTTDLEDGTVMGATVRIGDGPTLPADAFDSTNDRLIIDGVVDEDITQNGNSITYAEISFQASSSNTWTFDATYLINQGVMEIEVDGDDGVPSLEMIEFLRDRVNYQNAGTATGNREVIFTLGLNTQGWDGHEDGTTHYYQFVESDSAINWTDARTAASNSTFFGQPGYLATITSFVENRFLADRFNDGGGPPAGWLGGSDASDISDTDWIWVDGPEAGQRFWENDGSGGQYITGSGLDGQTNNVNQTCAEQTVAWNGSTHESDSWFSGGNWRDDRWRLVYGYTETLDSNGRPVGNRRFANWSCFNSSTGFEPNGGNTENYLQMTGSGVGGGMWNDLANSASTGTDSPYRVNGYYVEYGGPEKSDFGIRNLKLSQTSSFSTTSCGVVHTPPDALCRAWSDLDAAQTAAPGVADFYSPGTLNNDREVFGRTRTVAHVYVNHENYNISTDRLVIAGSTASSGGVGITNYAAVDVDTDASGSDETFSVTGKYYANQGYLKVNSSTGATASEWADILNQVVEYQNNGGASESDFSIARSITYTLGGGIAWPYHPDGTTHFYRYKEDDDITWSSARTNALSGSTNYYGETGYLATITSEAEHEFLARNMVRPDGSPIIAWLGGTDEDTEGTWIWKDGPEAGIQFWSSYLTNGKPVLSGNGNIDSTFSLPSCQQQIEDRDGSVHNSGTDVHVLDMLQGTTAEASPHRYTKWSCAPNNPNNRPEPSGEPSSTPQEDWLILSATARGGETWNDVVAGGSTGSDWLNTTGYLQEFGGDNEYFNRSTTQTFTVTPAQCVMERETSTSGCLPGADLTIGNSSTDDFFGPGTDVSNASITQARVQIINGFVSNSVSDRDELALRGTNGDLINNSRTRRYEDVPLINGSNIVDVNGEYDFITGVLRLTSESAVPASAMVAFINQRVQLIASDSSTQAKDIGFTLGDALVWTGHEDDAIRYYRFVPYSGSDTRTWTVARDGARSSAQEYFGVPGYLATITSKAENDFIAGSFANLGSPIAGWIGGSDNRDSGVWEWTTGPEGGNTTSAGTDDSDRMQFWAGNAGTGTQPVNLTGTAITGSPPTSGPAQLSGSVGCAANDAACCEDQYPAYHGQTPEQATTAADELGQTGGVLKHHFYGYSESIDSMGNVTINTGKRFANWSCNGDTPQPSDSGGQNFLLVTGSPLGNGMWNDVQNGGITSAADIYSQQGYYVEYGGGAVNGGGTWQDNFNDRRIGRVVRVPQGCEMPDGGFQRVE